MSIKSVKERQPAARRPKRAKSEVIPFSGGLMTFNYREEGILLIMFNQEPPVPVKRALTSAGFYFRRRITWWEQAISPEAITRANEIISQYFNECKNDITV